MHEHDGILTLLQIPDVTERLLALRSRQVQPFHLRQALADADEQVRRAAVLHPNMTPELLTEVLAGDDKDLRHAALTRPDLTDDHLEMMGVQPEHALEVARHSRCHLDLRHRLLNHDIPQGVKDVHRAAIDHVQHIDYPGMNVVAEPTSPKLEYQWHPRQPHPHDDEMWYENPYQELAKSKKDALKMYKPEDPGFSTAKEHVDWAYKTAPNENWALWTVRSHRKEPDAWTPEVKQKFEEHSSIVHTEPMSTELKNVRFDKSHSLLDGMGMLNEAKSQYINRTMSKMRLAGKPPTAKKLLDLGNNWAWWDLGQSYCKDEGQAMGHCGNTAAAVPTDTVLSLRHEHTIAGTKYWEPHATFIKNGNILGEMKGRGNKKPEPQYNPEIIKLINSQGLLPFGGGHAEENNFSLRDLTPEQLATVREDVRKAHEFDFDAMTKFARDTSKPRPHFSSAIQNPAFAEKWQTSFSKQDKLKWLPYIPRSLNWLESVGEHDLIDETMDRLLSELNGAGGKKYSEGFDSLLRFAGSTNHQPHIDKIGKHLASTAVGQWDLPHHELLRSLGSKMKGELVNQFLDKGFVPDTDILPDGWERRVFSPEGLAYQRQLVERNKALGSWSKLSQLAPSIPDDRFHDVVDTMMSTHQASLGALVAQDPNVTPEKLKYTLDKAQELDRKNAIPALASYSERWTDPKLFDTFFNHLLDTDISKHEDVLVDLFENHNERPPIKLSDEVQKRLWDDLIDAPEAVLLGTMKFHLEPEQQLALYRKFADKGSFRHLGKMLASPDMSPDVVREVLSLKAGSEGERVLLERQNFAKTLHPENARLIAEHIKSPQGTEARKFLLKYPTYISRVLPNSEDQLELVGQLSNKFGVLWDVNPDIQDRITETLSPTDASILATALNMRYVYGHEIESMGEALQEKVVRGADTRDDRVVMPLFKLQNLRPDLAQELTQKFPNQIWNMAVLARTPSSQRVVLDFLNDPNNDDVSGDNFAQLLRNADLDPTLQPEVLKGLYQYFKDGSSQGTPEENFFEAIVNYKNYYRLKWTPESQQFLDSVGSLAKNIGLVTYPQLGEPTAYTKPMTETLDQSRIRAKYSGTSPKGNGGWISGTYNDNPERGILPYNQLTTASATIDPPARPASLQTSKKLRDMGVADPLKVYQTAQQIDAGKRLNTIEHHEAQHSIFHRLGQKFGEMNKIRIVATTLSRLNQQHRDHIQSLYDAAGVSVGDITTDPEESIAYLHNYLMDPNYRRIIHRKMGLYNKDEQQASQELARKAWNQLRRIAASLHPKDMGIDLDSYKNRVDAWLKTLAKRESMPSDQLGFSVSFAELIATAKFLTGLNIDIAEVRQALRAADGDPKKGVLIAYGLNTPEGEKAFDSVRQMRKSEGTDILKAPKSIQGVSPDSERTVEHLREAYKLNQVEPVTLLGKHSGGAYIAKLDHTIYLLKPGSGKKSPAAGVDETKASQSRRETAFSALAKLMGIKEVKPAYLLLVDGKEVACMEMWPQNWVNLHRTMTEEPNLPREACEPYRRTGELFKWSVLDFVSGNADRHGNNIMVSSADDGNKLGLIDHGSAFAGPSFDPGHDSDSFVPYYLRVWAGADFHGLHEAEQLKQMPTINGEADKSLREWVNGIDSDDVSRVLLAHGIDPVFVLARLDETKKTVDADESASRATNRLWLASPQE